MLCLALEERSDVRHEMHVRAELPGHFALVDVPRERIPNRHFALLRALLRAAERLPHRAVPCRVAWGASATRPVLSHTR